MRERERKALGKAFLFGLGIGSSFGYDFGFAYGQQLIRIGQMLDWL